MWNCFFDPRADIGVLRAAKFKCSTYNPIDVNLTAPLCSSGNAHSIAFADCYQHINTHSARRDRVTHSASQWSLAHFNSRFETDWVGRQ